jgi:uncharacterized membrane protein (DUF4010 family)
MLAGVLNEALGRRGVTISAAVAGFADSQSAAVSVASLVAAGKLPAAEAAVPVLAALSTNTISKAVVALALGKRPCAVRCDWAWHWCSARRGWATPWPR